MPRLSIRNGKGNREHLKMHLRFIVQALLERNINSGTAFSSNYCPPPVLTQSSFSGRLAAVAIYCSLRNPEHLDAHSACTLVDSKESDNLKKKSSMGFSSVFRVEINGPSIMRWIYD
ncbi:hypothetical protein YC2023_042033 [Brassica napus]